MTTITNNFNDVSNLVRMAYDYFYNPNKTLCYKVKPINISDFDHINSYKIILSSEKVDLFANSFLNDKLIYLKKVFTPYGYKHIIKKISDPYSVNLSLFVYNTDDQNDMFSSQNIDKVFLKLFSDFLTYEQSKHILLQIINIDIGLSDIEEFLLSMSELKDLINIDNIKNKTLSIGITEHFRKMTSLVDFLTNDILSSWTDNQYKSLIFQVLHTLSIIQNKYPNFRHNNITLKNIDGYLKSGAKGTTNYSFNGEMYNVENIDFFYKMSNFENSTIVDILPNADIDENLRNIDHFYDIEVFLKSLLKHVEHLNISIPENTKKFIDRVLTNNKIDKTKFGVYVLFNDEYFDNIRLNKDIKVDHNKQQSRLINNRVNKNKKQDIIENKLSTQNLSESMSKPSFLYKGTRKINQSLHNVDDTINLNDEKEKKIVQSGTYRRNNDSESSFDMSDEQPKPKDFNQQETKRQTPNNGIKKSALANALRATNDEIKKSNIEMNQFSQMGMSQMNNIPQYDMAPQMNMQNGNKLSGILGSSNQIDMMPQMGMPPMGMPQMGMPPMGIPPMNMPQMGMPQMGMPQMDMNSYMPQMGNSQINNSQIDFSQFNIPQQMGMPPMNMPQMGMPPMNMPPMNMPQMNMPQMNMPQMSQENIMKQYEQWMGSNAYNGMMGGAEKEEKLNDTVDTETFFFRQKQN
jgi:hypothetical protein